MPEALRVTNITKRFGGVTVLDAVSLAVPLGEVHGIVGENGSGKSTLVKILAGIHTPERGAQVAVLGRQVEFPVRRPERHGLAIIHQDLGLAESLSVADNLGLAVSFDTRLASPIKWRRERRIARELLAEFGLDVDIATLAGELTPAERAIVAILRALRQIRQRHGSGCVLVLDEPTAALPRFESQRLLSIVRSLADADTCAVVFIGHRMKEVLGLCDRVSVLRNGRLVTTLRASETTEREVIRHMIGVEIDDFYPAKAPARRGGAMLQVDGLTGGSIRDVSFSVERGEILGITGIAGMGQDELPYLIAGGRPRSAGTVTVDGTPIRSAPRRAIEAGLVLVPANRHRDALWLEATASENLTLPFLRRFVRGGVLRRRHERAFVAAQMASYSVRPPSPAMAVARFSGGNQQKLVVARCLQLSPRIVLLHEPTQGVDAGAKKEILSVVRQVADDGAAVVLFSSDGEEVAETANRVLVMSYGQVAAELDGGGLTESALLTATQAVAAPETPLRSWR